MEDTSARKQSRTPATAIRVTVVVAAMLAVTAATLSRSHSAFSGTTSYGEGNIQSATVNLDGVAAKDFDVSNMVPGDTIVRCVDVAYNGTATADQLESVRVFGTESSGGGLAQYLEIKAEMGNAGATCASPDTWSGMMLGTMDTVFTKHSDYATAYDSTWTPSAAGEKRAFQFTVTMPASTGNEAQKLTARPTITWEIHTTNGTQR